MLAIFFKLMLRLDHNTNISVDVCCGHLTMLKLIDLKIFGCSFFLSGLSTEASSLFHENSSVDRKKMTESDFVK